jgi:hypothetical protein
VSFVVYFPRSKGIFNLKWKFLFSLKGVAANEDY